MGEVEQKDDLCNLQWQGCNRVFFSILLGYLIMDSGTFSIHMLPSVLSLPVLSLSLVYKRYLSPLWEYICGQKSHQYYYYICNGSFKQGQDACDARALPKDKLEQLVIEQIKEKVLNQEWLEELAWLVNKELDSTHDILMDRLETIDAELNDARIRLSKLYDTLETDKLSLDDLAPRIKELRAR